jgi:excisionase family DNA binding protein
MCYSLFAVSIDAADQLLSPQRIAEILDVSEVSVRRWISNGQLEAVRLGDGPNPHLRVSGSALAGFLRSTRQVERAVASHSGVERATR